MKITSSRHHTFSLHDPASRRRGGIKKALLGLLLLILLVGAVGAVAVSRGAGSKPTEEIRAEILALGKNKPFAEALKEVPIPGSYSVGVSGADAQVSALYAHFPRQSSDVEGEALAPMVPMVFVHGTPDTMGAWETLLFGPGALEGQESIYTLEVTGHGMAGSDAELYSFQHCADYVVKAIDALGLEKVTLVGNSYGAEFCWRAAADRPDLISKLVLIDSSGLPRTEEQFLSEEVKMRNWSVARYGYLLNSEERVAYALNPHFDGAAPKQRIRETFLGLENRDHWNAMVDLVRDENGERRDDLNKLAMPTLLIFGEHDQAYPPETFGKEFEARIPDAQLRVIAGAGHYPHEQEPAEVAGLILGFHRDGLADLVPPNGSSADPPK